MLYLQHICVHLGLPVTTLLQLSITSNCITPIEHYKQLKPTEINSLFAGIEVSRYEWHHFVKNKQEVQKSLFSTAFLHTSIISILMCLIDVFNSLFLHTSIINIQMCPNSHLKNV